MATIDVSDAFDESFLSEMTVIRRSETIDNHGRSVITSTEIKPAPLGVIVPSSPNNLDRSPDRDLTNKSITVYTQFRLQANAPNYKPDLVVFRGSEYIVNSIDDYTQFGAGFIVATAISETPVDPPPQ